MKYTKLNKELLEQLYKEDMSYKEISEITGYARKSVNSYFYRTKGKMVDDRKYRRNQIEISQEQKEIFFGTLLGDGNIQKQKIHSYSGRYNHSIKQELYCRHLSKVLEGLVSDVKYGVSKSKDKIYQIIYFSLKSNFKLKEFYDMFYIRENNKKDVPLDLSLLTPRAMAYWFMDDGYPSSKCSIGIATCSFSLEGLLRLQKYLKDTYNIETNIQKDFKLYFKASSALIFYNLVKEYILPSMEYKFKFINHPLLI